MKFKVGDKVVCIDTKWQSKKLKHYGGIMDWTVIKKDTDTPKKFVKCIDEYFAFLTPNL